MSDPSRSARATAASRSSSRKKVSISPSRGSQNDSVAAHSHPTRTSNSNSGGDPPSHTADACISSAITAPPAPSRTSATPSLTIEPAEIIFRDFVANETYEAVLTVYNNTAVSRFVRIARPDSHQVSISAMGTKSKSNNNNNVGYSVSDSAPHSTAARLAAGLSLRVRVLFTPDSDRHDYAASLPVITEDDNQSGLSEVYATVPVRGLRRRCQLELPEQLTLHDAPVRGTSRTALFLRTASVKVDCIWRAEVVCPPAGVQSGKTRTRERGLDLTAQSYSRLVGEGAGTGCFTAQTRALPSHLSRARSQTNHSNDDYEDAYRAPTATASRVGASAAPTTTLSSFVQILPSSGVVPSEQNGGNSIPAEIVFTPGDQVSLYDAVIVFYLGEEEDVVQCLPVRGRAVEVAVALEPAVVRFADIYVTTERQAVVTLHNHSDYTLQYNWRANYAAWTDLSQGARAIQSSTSTAQAASHDAQVTTGNDTNGSDDWRKDEEDEEDVHDRPFDDETFSIEPTRGTLYGRGRREFTVTFSPTLSGPHEVTAFLELTGRSARLPLCLTGHGIGPQCRLEYSTLHLGAIYTGALHVYDMELTNVGQIEAHYTVLPALSEMGKRFQFVPASGVVQPGQVQAIQMRVRSHAMGCIDETIRFHLHGAALEAVTLHVTGEVIGPTFSFSEKAVHFGCVAYDSVHVREVVLTNTSEIGMKYRLHLPQISPYTREFVMQPAHGVLSAGAAQVIRITLRVQTVGVYDTEQARVLLDVVDRGDAVAVVVMDATGVVPELRLRESELDFGACFVGMCYTRWVTVENATPLCGKFELCLGCAKESGEESSAVQLTLGKAVGTDTSTPVAESADDNTNSNTNNSDDNVSSNRAMVPTKGGRDSMASPSMDRLSCHAQIAVIREESVYIIEPYQTVRLPITLCMHASTAMCSTLRLYRCGAAKEAEDEAGARSCIRLTAHGCGPVVKMLPSSVNFGVQPVLHSSERTVELRNTSPVPAEFEMRWCAQRKKHIPIAAAIADPLNVSSLTASTATAAAAAAEAKTILLSTAESVRAAAEMHGMCSAALAESESKAFAIRPMRGVIEPHGSVTLVITACVNEAIAFKDAARLCIRHGSGDHTPHHHHSHHTSNNTIDVIDNLSAADDSAKARTANVDGAKQQQRNDGMNDVSNNSSTDEADEGTLLSLRAAGKGVPLVFETDLADLHVGDVFTETAMTREVRVWNRGWCDQSVQWCGVRASTSKDRSIMPNNMNRVSADTTAGSSGNPSSGSTARAPVFSIKPEHVVIAAGAAVTFRIDGLSHEVGTWSEEFILKQSGSSTQVMRSRVSGHFVDPTLCYSAPELHFDYTAPLPFITAAQSVPPSSDEDEAKEEDSNCRPSDLTGPRNSTHTTADYTTHGNDAIPSGTKDAAADSEPHKRGIVQTVTMTNPTQLTVAVTLQLREPHSPFSLVGGSYASRFMLASHTAYVVAVRFVPPTQHYPVSHDIRHRLLIHFDNHPRTETLPLTARLRYPSLRLGRGEDGKVAFASATAAAAAAAAAVQQRSQQTKPHGSSPSFMKGAHDDDAAEVIDFGTVLRDTEERRSIVLVNEDAELPATFTWHMLTGELDAQATPRVNRAQAGQSRSVSKRRRSTYHDNGTATKANKSHGNSDTKNTTSGTTRSNSGNTHRAREEKEDCGTSSDAGSRGSRVYDFVPHTGTVAPGASRVIEVVFYGQPGTHEASAMCAVSNGRGVRVGLRGCAGALQLSYSTTSLDFGVMPYYASAVKTITLVNPSRVAAPFVVSAIQTHQTDSLTYESSGCMESIHSGADSCCVKDSDDVPRAATRDDGTPGKANRVGDAVCRIAQQLTVTPRSGTVRNRVCLHVRFSPVIPAAVVGSFDITVGHLEPQRIRVSGAGKVASVTLRAGDSVARVTRVPEPYFVAAYRALGEAVARQEIDSSARELEAQRRAFVAMLKDCYAASAPSPAAAAADAAAVLATDGPTSYEGDKTDDSSDVAGQQDGGNDGDARNRTMHAVVNGYDDISSSNCHANGRSQTHNKSERTSVEMGLAVAGGMTCPVSAPRRRLRRNSTSAAGVDKLILASYLVDVGHMARADTRTTRLRLRNNSSLGTVSGTNSSSDVVHVLLDSKELAALPLTVSPAEPSKLNPQQEVSLELTVHAAHPAIRHGSNLFDFTLDLRGGPVVVVRCAVYVAAPQLCVSTATLDFEHVLLGQLCVRTLVLTNEQAVPCAWRVHVKAHGTAREGGGARRARMTDRAGVEVGVSMSDGHADSPQADGSSSNNNSSSSSSSSNNGSSSIVPVSGDDSNSTKNSVLTSHAAHSAHRRLIKAETMCDYNAQDGEDEATASPAFWCAPTYGTVAALETVTLAVGFAPQRAGVARAGVRFLFSGSTRHVSVMCVGVGRRCGLTFDPPSLQLAVMAPYSVHRAAVMVTNHEAAAVEMYSAALDEQFQMEHHILGEALALVTSASLTATAAAATQSSRSNEDNNSSNAISSSGGRNTTHSNSHLHRGNNTKSNDGNESSRKGLLLPTRAAGEALPHTLLEAVYARLRAMDLAVQAGEGKGADSMSMKYMAERTGIPARAEDATTGAAGELTQKIDACGSIAGKKSKQQQPNTRGAENGRLHGRRPSSAALTSAPSFTHSQRTALRDGATAAAAASSTAQRSEVSRADKDALQESKDLCAAPSNRRARPPSMVVLLGPPQSGKTTQARYLCARYDYALLDLDSLIALHEGCTDSSSDQSGAAAHAATTTTKINNTDRKHTEDASATAQSSDTAVMHARIGDEAEDSPRRIAESIESLTIHPFASSPLLQQQQQQQRHSSQASATARVGDKTTAVALPRSSTPRPPAAEADDSIMSSLAQVAATLEERVVHYLGTCMNETESNGAQTATATAAPTSGSSMDTSSSIQAQQNDAEQPLQRLSSSSCVSKRGIVVDDVQCQAMPNKVWVLYILHRACARVGVSLSILSLAVSPATQEQRRMRAHWRYCEACLAAARMEPLAEDVYARLDEAARHRYNRQLHFYHACRRELQRTVRLLEQLTTRMSNEHGGDETNSTAPEHPNKSSSSSSNNTHHGNSNRHNSSRKNNTSLSNILSTTHVMEEEREDEFRRTVQDCVAAELRQEQNSLARGTSNASAEASSTGNGLARSRRVSPSESSSVERKTRAGRRNNNGKSKNKTSKEADETVDEAARVRAMLASSSALDWSHMAPLTAFKALHRWLLLHPSSFASSSSSSSTLSTATARPLVPATSAASSLVPVRNALDKNEVPVVLDGLLTERQLSRAIVRYVKSHHTCRSSSPAAQTSSSSNDKDKDNNYDEDDDGDEQSESLCSSRSGHDSRSGGNEATKKADVNAEVGESSCVGQHAREQNESTWNVIASHLGAHPFGTLVLDTPRGDAQTVPVEGLFYYLDAERWVHMGAQRLCDSSSAAGRPSTAANPTHPRFFSPVEREVVVNGRNKSAKTRTALPVRAYEELTRWRIPPQSTVELMVEVCTMQPGMVHHRCRFGIVGATAMWELPVCYRVAVPDINRDERVIFPVVRSRLSAGMLLPSASACMSGLLTASGSLVRTFVSSCGVYFFGPVLIPPPPPERQPVSMPTTRRYNNDHLNDNLPNTSSLKSGLAPASPVVAKSTAASTASPAVHNSSHTSHASFTSVTETLTLTNSGWLDADITVCFDNERTKTFTVQPQRFTLSVGQTQTVQLTAAPDCVGEQENRLVVCVAGNARPWVATLRCLGTRPAMTLDDKKEREVNFGKVVLHRAVEECIQLRNVSAVAVRWQLRGCEKLPPELSVSDTEGTLEVNGSVALTVRFVPTMTCLHAVALSVVVSTAGGAGSVARNVNTATSNNSNNTTNSNNNNSNHTSHKNSNSNNNSNSRSKSNSANSRANFSQLSSAVLSSPSAPVDVYEVLPLTLRAEATDIVLEWTREVNFGRLHVGETRQESIRMLNKSPYDVAYLIRMPKRLQSILCLTPSSGVMRGMLGYRDAAVANVEVTARFTREGEIAHTLGALEVAFYDPLKQEMLYPMQTIAVRGEAWYAHATLRPTSIDFGSCLYHQTRQATVELRNTGHFAVHFRLVDAASENAVATKAVSATSAVTPSRAGGGGNQSAGSALLRRVASVSATSEASAADTDAESTRTTTAALAKSSGNNNSTSKLHDTEFRVGCFTIAPARGVVPVGEALTLTVVALPEHDSRTREVVGITYDHSASASAALSMTTAASSHGSAGAMNREDSLQLELTAHPAAPSILCDLDSAADVATIFEEQQVVRRFDQWSPRSIRAYASSERTFSFGTVLVGRRVEERFRIANSSSLACVVVAQILSAVGGTNSIVGASNNNSNNSGMSNPVSNRNSSGSPSSSVNASGANNNSSNSGASPIRAASSARVDGYDLRLDQGKPMATVRLELPPFESRFITVGFTAPALQRYEAKLLAMVERTPDGRNSTLMFRLRGEGTLPNIHCDFPPPLSHYAIAASAANRAENESPATAAASAASPLSTLTTSLAKPSHMNKLPGAAGGGNAGLGGGASNRNRMSGAHVVSSSSSPPRGSHNGSTNAVNSKNTSNVDATIRQSASIALESSTDESGSTVVELPLTRMGGYNARGIKVRNTGVVDAVVRLTVLRGSEAPAGFELPQCNRDVTIAAGVTQEWTMGYRPTNTRNDNSASHAPDDDNSNDHNNVQYVNGMMIRTVSVRLRLTVRDNPFEGYDFTLRAGSVDSAVSFDEMEPTRPDQLHMGDCYLHTPQSRRFVMRNNTPHMLRYVWSSPAMRSDKAADAHGPPYASNRIRQPRLSLSQQSNCTRHKNADTAATNHSSNNTNNDSSDSRVDMAESSAAPELQVSPSMGHLPPGGTRLVDMSLTVHESSGSRVRAVSCAVALQPIQRYEAGEWDSTMYVEKWLVVDSTELQKQQQHQQQQQQQRTLHMQSGAGGPMGMASRGWVDAPGRRNLRRTQEPLAEPRYRVLGWNSQAPRASNATEDASPPASVHQSVPSMKVSTAKNSNNSATLPVGSVSINDDSSGIKGIVDTSHNPGTSDGEDGMRVQPLYLSYVCGVPSCELLLVNVDDGGAPETVTSLMTTTTLDPPLVTGVSHSRLAGPPTSPSQHHSHHNTNSTKNAVSPTVGRSAGGGVLRIAPTKLYERRILQLRLRNNGTVAAPFSFDLSEEVPDEDSSLDFDPHVYSTDSNTKYNSETCRNNNSNVRGSKRIIASSNDKCTTKNDTKSNKAKSAATGMHHHTSTSAMRGKAAVREAVDIDSATCNENHSDNDEDEDTGDELVWGDSSEAASRPRRFTVTPASGLVAPHGGTQDIALIFAPTSCPTRSTSASGWFSVMAQLRLSLPHSIQSDTCLRVEAAMECPLVHVQLPPSSFSTSLSSSSLDRLLTQGVSAETAAALTAAAAANTSSSSVLRSDSSRSSNEQQPLLLRFVTRGLHTRGRVRFKILNPTDAVYAFEWVELLPSVLDTAGAQSNNNNNTMFAHAQTVAAVGLSPFRCLISSGVLMPGRRTEMGFEFVADALGVRERQWLFQVVSRNSVGSTMGAHGSNLSDRKVLMAIPFTLIGTAYEPRVWLSESRLDFGPVRLRQQTERGFVIENHDEVRCCFRFERRAVEKGVITVRPLRGVVQPGGRLPVTVSFAPGEEQSYNMTLLCHVRRATETLKVNIKGEGVAMHDTLRVETGAHMLPPGVEQSSQESHTIGSSSNPDTLVARDANDSEEEEATGSVRCVRQRVTYVALGRVAVHDTVTRDLTLANDGAHAFDFVVRTQASENESVVVVVVDGGTGVVQPHGRARIRLRVSPNSLPQGSTAHSNRRSTDQTSHSKTNKNTAVLANSVSAAATGSSVVTRVLVYLAGELRYTIDVQTVVYVPRLRLSSDCVDFGPRFTVPYMMNQAGHTVTLTMTNVESKTMTVDCIFASAVSTANGPDIPLVANTVNQDNGNDTTSSTAGASMLSHAIIRSGMLGVAQEDDTGNAERPTWCELDNTSFLLRPGSSAELTLRFTPHSVRTYRDILQLVLHGGLHTMQVPVSGEGIIPQIEVAPHFVRLGTARVGETRSAEIRLECRSRAVTPVSLVGGLDEESVRCGLAVVAVTPAMASPSTAAAAASSSVMLLKPREVRIVTVRFTPPRRMPVFERELGMVVCGQPQPCAVLSGSCEDHEIHLSARTVSFGEVLCGSVSTQRVVLLNSGDVSQRFAWSLAMMSSSSSSSGSSSSAANAVHTNAASASSSSSPIPILSVHPATGFTRAHSETVCVFRYAPTACTGDVLRGSVTLALESAPSLTVSLDGRAVGPPEPRAVLHFRCRARESAQERVTLENPSSHTVWSCVPVCDPARVWSCSPAETAVRPHGKVELTITYSPRLPTVFSSVQTPLHDSRSNSRSNTKPANGGAVGSGEGSHPGNTKQDNHTSEATSRGGGGVVGKPDRGMMFIPLPDGGGWSYALEGVAEAAGPAGPALKVQVEPHMTQNVRCVVHNWTAEPLRFTRELRWSSRKEGGGGGSGNNRDDIDEVDGELVVKGASGIEVGGGGSAEYVLCVMAVRPGARYVGTVHFTCAEHPEVAQYYPVEVTVATSASSVSAAATMATTAAGMSSSQRFVMTTPVRRRLTRAIPLANSLNKPVTLQCRVEYMRSSTAMAQQASSSSNAGRSIVTDSNSSHISLKGSSNNTNSNSSNSNSCNTLAGLVMDALAVPATVTVPAQSTAPLTVEYFPLLHRAETSEVRLVVSSPEWGTSTYLLELTSLPARPEAVTQLSCSLGQSAVFTVSFVHYSRTSADFAIRIGSANISGHNGTNNNISSNMNNSAGAEWVRSGAIAKLSHSGGNSLKAHPTTRPAGQTLSMDFVFEPFAVGTIREAIEFVSATAGTYSFPVTAVCTPPARQGPIAMRPGQTTPIAFKNVFMEPVTITVTTDSANFTPARRTETVAARKSVNIPVACRAAEEGSEAMKGKLVVSCVPPGGGASAVEWVYYLDATRVEGAGDGGGGGGAGTNNSNSNSNNNSNYVTANRVAGTKK